MRRSIPLWSVALVAAPLAISHPDSSVTEFRIAGGTGSYAYVTRGCDNSVISKQRIGYDNVGGEVSHKFTAPIRIGVRAGQIHADEEGYYGPASSTVRFVNPHLSLDWPGFSIGGGWVHGDQHFPGEDFDETASGHIRIGKRIYFETSFCEAVPLATAGYGQTGVGFRFRKGDLWLGLGTVPYDGAGFVGRGEYRFGNRLGVGGTVRLGSSEGISENAFAVALSYRWVHGPKAATEPPAPATEPPPATTPAASDSARSPRRGRSRAPRGRRSRRAPC
jgi:hypothetical protein